MPMKRITFFIISIASFSFMYGATIGGPTEAASGQERTYSFNDSIKIPTTYKITVTNGTVQWTMEEFLLNDGNQTIYFDITWKTISEGSVTGTILVTNKETKAVVASRNVTIKAKSSPTPPLMKMNY